MIHVVGLLSLMALSCYAVGPEQGKSHPGSPPSLSFDLCPKCGPANVSILYKDASGHSYNEVRSGYSIPLNSRNLSLIQLTRGRHVAVYHGKELTGRLEKTKEEGSSGWIFHERPAQPHQHDMSPQKTPSSGKGPALLVNVTSPGMVSIAYSDGAPCQTEEVEGSSEITLRSAMRNVVVIQIARSGRAELFLAKRLRRRLLKAGSARWYFNEDSIGAYAEKLARDATLRMELLARIHQELYGGKPPERQEEEALAEKVTRELWGEELPATSGDDRTLLAEKILLAWHVLHDDAGVRDIAEGAGARVKEACSASPRPTQTESGNAQDGREASRGGDVRDEQGGRR